MAEICMDVDTALSEVPVNIAPLIDDTDFKTIEDAIAYNAAGMDLRWNFVTTGGAYTSTAVTPTTAGTYDWTHQGDGMYSIEIPASGGASINNDTEGFGWFSGKATGVLPWRGPIICFRSASLNNALVDGSINLPVNVIQVQTSDDAATGLSTAGLHYDAYDHFDTDQNLLSSAITTVNSQTEFVLTSGSTVDNAYLNRMVVLNGALSERHSTVCTAYVGATRTMTVRDAAYWTVDTADSINIIAVPQQVTALPTATAGAAGGVFIAGTNAATSVTTALTANITGNLSGSVGSVTGAVGSVTGNVGGNVAGSVGSVTGAVGSVTGNVGGSVGSVATGGITAASIATNAIDADALAADAVAEIQAGLATSAAQAIAQADLDTITGNDGAILNTTQPNYAPATAAALATVEGKVDTADAAIDAVATTIGVAGAGLTEAGGTGDQLTALATQASVNDLPTNAELATALAAADDAVLAAIAALNNLSAAQVNAEVVDALATDTYAEPGQGAPAATASIAAKINYLFKAWRNKKTQTSTTFSLFADDTTTVDQKATTSDDGTTTTIGEIATGP